METRTCLCGCGKTFEANTFNRVFFNPKHAMRFYIKNNPDKAPAARYRKKRKTKYTLSGIPVRHDAMCKELVGGGSHND